MEDFPISYLLPKRETQVESFLKKYPEYDGENILIAIFDSGIDPGAAGLQKTVSGQQKIVDLIDCSGSGDVDTSAVVDVVEDGVIEGKTGRKLKIPISWNNPSGKYHVGMKDAFSLLPVQVRKRVQQERKEKNWIPAHNLSLANATRKLIEFEHEYSNPSTEEEKSTHEDLKQLVDSLKVIDRKYEDVGPVYDCVVFHDGEMWRACVDTSETGDLDSCELLGPFKLTGQYARLTREDMMNFTISVYEDGKRLSIVTSNSDHGTHVASIAVAYFEEQPELNGIAPGAQVISMKIGDNRIHRKNTGSAIIRAVKCAIDYKVDIINMSCGDGAKWPHEGRVIEAIDKMVEQHNIMFFTSAGNLGPALSTLNCPGAVTRNVIAVGAYLSPDVMTAEYSVLEKVPGTVYCWSSKGPCMDGSLGVSITAPGCAITSVPNWTLSRNMLMSGTSMASPNAAGCVGALLSALKKENISYSPDSVRRAIENTALSLNDTSRFAQGYGLIQVEKSFEFMKELRNLDKFYSVLKFEVSWKKMLGIYIREISQYHLSKYNVVVKPEFNKNTDNKLRIRFNINTNLESTALWVKCPKHLQLANGSRDIPISIDSKCLENGCHYAEVQGFDLQQVDLGPIFRIPITVIVPEVVENFNSVIDLNLQIFKPHIIQRRFYFVPYGTTWATLTLTSHEKEKDVCYLVDVVQLVKDTNFNIDTFRQDIAFLANSEDPKEYIIKLTGGYTVEVVIGRQWRVTGDTDVQATIQFHSLEPDNKQVTLTTSDRFTKVCVKNELAHEDCDPKVNLTHRVIPLIPKEKSLSPLTDRDLLPDNEQIYSMVLTYQFFLTKSHDVTIRFNSLSDLMYENKFESQLCMIYDSNKRLCGTSDAFPFRSGFKFRLDKGDFTAKIQVRHSSIKLLESIKELPAELFLSLPSSIRLDVYESRYKLLTNTSKIRMKTFLPKEESIVYIAAPAASKYPSGMKPGEKLVGKISYSHKANVSTKVYFPFQLIITSSVKVSTDTKNKDEKDTKKVEDEYSESFQDFVVSWIPRLTESELLDKLLKETGEDSLKVLDAQLRSLDSGKNRQEKLQGVVNLAKRIVERIDEQALLAYLGMKVDPDADAVQKRSEMGQLKKYYINSNYILGLAAADMINESDDPDPTLMDDLDAAYRNMMKVVGMNEADMLKLTVRHGLAHKQYGRSLKALFKYFEDHGYTKEHFQTFIQLVTLCGWDHIASHLRNTELMKFPNDYQLF